MLRIIKPFDGKTAKNADVGDLNEFLRDVLVEVASENYRQTMYEAMALASITESGIQYDIDPPLRANERVISGLFATAISKVALRSRTEARVDRPERDTSIDALEHDLESENTSSTKNGRVDYLAWYSSRVIGIELKSASMNCEAPKITKLIQERWNNAVDQAKTVQSCLRLRQKEDGRRYPNPVSIALMVIVGRRRISLDNNNFYNVDGELHEMKNASLSSLNELNPQPAFISTYIFPQEFRALSPRRKGREAPKEGKAVYTPFVWFIAKPAINSTVK